MAKAVESDTTDPFKDQVANGSARRDTHIPAVECGLKTIKSDGGSSVDREVFTDTVIHDNDNLLSHHARN